MHPLSGTPGTTRTELVGENSGCCVDRNVRALFQIVGLLVVENKLMVNGGFDNSFCWISKHEADQHWFYFCFIVLPKELLPHDVESQEHMISVGGIGD
ncbi:hypothetical protein Tco_0196439 [Tanacetum coccineum]|uniref:Uncharacterized protein n=1 Tax=Tanacetum coccineum TaxID=301880 RepID=A0ABQ4ZM59_9ASTR